MAELSTSGRKSFIAESKWDLILKSVSCIEIYKACVCFSHMNSDMIHDAISKIKMFNLTKELILID